MRKISALCLSLLVAGVMSASAGEKTLATKLPKHAATWRPVSVQGMHKRTTATEQLRKLGLSANKAAATADVSTPAAPGFGFLTGPDGTQWYYTQDFEATKTGYTSHYTKSTITIFDSANAKAGEVTVEVPTDKMVNAIEPFGSITAKLFDRNDKTYEMMVSLHVVGNADNNYQSAYITQAYSLTGEKVAEYDGAGLFFDASKDWNTYQRMLLPHTVVDDNGGETYAVDVIAPPGWNDTETKVEHTFYIPDSLTNYSDGSFLNTFVVDDKPYYVISHYNKPYVAYYDPDTWDMVLNDSLAYVIKTYDKNFTLVDSLYVPLEKPDDALYRFASFALMSDKDLSAGYFTPAGERAYVVTFSDYLISSDSENYDFVIYDSKGNKLKTICEDAIESQWGELSPIKGYSDQMFFLQSKGTDAQQIQMIDMPSCEKATLIPATINGEGITSTLDRYPVGDSYQYVINMANADTDNEGNTIARIGWYTTDLKLDHMVKINLGQEGEYFTPLINEQTLNPYLFNTDDKMEYIYLAKKRRTDGSNKIDNVLEIANEDGKILESYNADGDFRVRTPAVLAMTQTKNQLMIGMYNDTTETYRLDFYDLPFTKFENGGDGTADNPYMIATIGDLLQVNSALSANYKLAANLDFATYRDYWEPLGTFSGSFDGDGHTISNLAIDTEEPDAGLFANLDQGSKVSNLVMVNPTITVNPENYYVGVLAGKSVGDTIYNVHIYDAEIAAADMTDSNIWPETGGFVGRATLYSEARACSFDNGTINLPNASNVGGIYGQTMTSAGVTACAARVNITGKSAVGGIIGTSGTSSEMKDCHANVTLTAQNTVGGIVGENSGRGLVARCFAEGSVEATAGTTWGGLSAGGIVGKLESGWQEANVAIAECLADVDITIPENESTTVHRIVGRTIADETYEPGEKHRTETGLENNYAISTMTVAGNTVESADTASVEGASLSIDDANTAFFQTLGYAYGSTIAAPWKGNSLPQLYFENAAMAVLLSETSLTLNVGETIEIEAAIYGDEAETLECISTNSEVADVEIVDIRHTDNASSSAVAVLRITAYADGEAVINVAEGDAKAECSVVVGGSTGIKAATVKTNAISFRLAADAIVADGATSVNAYTADGRLAAASQGSSLSTAKMGKGVYIVVANDSEGHKQTAKIVVK